MESMLQSIPDPFETYGTPMEDRLFSVLQPLSLLSEDSPSTSIHSQSTPLSQSPWIPSNDEDRVSQRPDTEQAVSTETRIRTIESIMMQDSTGAECKGQRTSAQVGIEDLTVLY